MFLQLRSPEQLYVDGSDCKLQKKLSFSTVQTNILKNSKKVIKLLFVWTIKIESCFCNLQSRPSMYNSPTNCFSTIGQDLDPTLNSDTDKTNWELCNACTILCNLLFWNFNQTSLLLFIKSSKYLIKLYLI